jgi:nitrogen fixation/metabolism regulation signal transduction histidine kinase
MKGYKRRRYLIHFSSQFKYITISVLPAFLISIFCINLIFSSGELIFAKEKATIMKKAVEVNIIVDQTLLWLQKENYAREVMEKTGGLLKELVMLENSIQSSYFRAIQQWAAFKSLILFGVMVALVFVAIMSIIYSHRVAGPMYRLQKYMDTLSEGKDIPEVRFRSYDEFKEVGEALEKLRRFLKQKGYGQK